MIVGAIQLFQGSQKLIIPQYRNCLEEWATGIRITIELTAEKYSATYDGILVAMASIKKDTFHGPKFVMRLKSWAQGGVYVFIQIVIFSTDKS